MGKKEGKLYLNANKRLALDEEDGWHCGQQIDLLLCGVWVRTRIEMNMRGEWYAVGLPGLKLEGLTAREVSRYDD